MSRRHTRADKPAVVLVAACAAALFPGVGFAAVRPPAPAIDAATQMSSSPTLSQHAYLKASNTGATDTFGSSIAIDVTTVVVGAPGEDSSATGVNGSGADTAASSGAAYVFSRIHGSWTSQAYLKASNTGTSDGFGMAVAVDGSTIVVGAPKEQSNGTAQSNNAADKAGAVYIFVRSGITWTQQAYLKPTVVGAGDEFGTSVDIDGDTIIVGAPFEDSNNDSDPADNSFSDAGGAYVFVRSGTTWTQQRFLKAVNPEAGDHFGAAVAVSGDRAIVGAPDEDSNGTGVNGGANSDNSATDAGAAYTYARSGTAWSTTAYVKASNTGAGDQFGAAVSIDGDTAAVGASGEDGSTSGVNGADNNNRNDAGAAYVFTEVASTWSQQAYVKSLNTGQSDEFGASLGLSGDRLVVGAFGEDGSATGVNGNPSLNSATAAGAAYLYSRVATVWSGSAYIKASNTGANDQYGRSVGVTSELVLSGAEFEDGGTTGINGNQNDESKAAAGAAYVYGPSCTAARFNDVPTTHPFCGEIEWMGQTGISNGFGDGGFHPSADVSRQAMSAFLARLAGVIPPTCTSAPFTDVPVSHPFCKEIKWMDDQNISTGFPDGSFGPTLPVTRQAMAAFMNRFAGGPTPPACSSAPFTDVPTSHPFCPQIKWIKDNGISTGFGDGSFHPAENVTRQAIAAFMYRLNLIVYFGN